MAEIFAKYEIPYEGIYEVRRFDPATNTLEPEPAEGSSPSSTSHLRINSANARGGWLRRMMVRRSGADRVAARSGRPAG